MILTDDRSAHKNLKIAAAGEPADRPLHRVRLLRIGVPLAKRHHHPATAHHAAAPHGPGRRQGDKGEYDLFHDAYAYFGNQTCAADGLCATVCPVGVDTGVFTKDYRRRESTARGRAIGKWVADHYAWSEPVPPGLRLSHAVHGCSHPGHDRHDPRPAPARAGARPYWTPCAPKARPKPACATPWPARGASGLFPSCTTRPWAPRPWTRTSGGLRVCHFRLAKAGYDVVFPEGMKELCCG